VFIARPISGTFLVLTVVLIVILAAPAIRMARSRTFTESES
jgi:hypothetical protein